MYNIRYAVLMVLIDICLCDLMATSLLLLCNNEKIAFCHPRLHNWYDIIRKWKNIWSYMFLVILILYLDLKCNENKWFWHTLDYYSLIPLYVYALNHYNKKHLSSYNEWWFSINLIRLHYRWNHSLCWELND